MCLSFFKIGRNRLEKGRDVQETLFLLPSQDRLTYSRSNPGLKASLSYRIIILSTAKAAEKEARDA